MRPAAYYFTRDEILAEAASALKLSDQWASAHQYHTAAEYLARANALLSLVEVSDCGSVGGFDLKRKQPAPQGSPREKMQQRLEWLLKVPVRKDGT